MQVQIIIELNEKGQVLVNGPLENKVICYGLLDAAKDAVRSYNEQNAKKVVLAPAGAVPKER